MPNSPSFIWFEGYKTTNRAKAMLLEARKIFTKRTGKKPPRISQGGYNAGGVKASAGTHDRAAFDFATAGWPRNLWQAWEDALWEVGFAAWRRAPIRGLWPEHTHAIPKGDDLSRGAQAQEIAFVNRRDGLAGNRSYSRIGKWATQTWEKYKKAHPPKKYINVLGKKYPDIDAVSVYWINQNRRVRPIVFSRNVWYVQVWLKRVGYYSGSQNGYWNPVAQKGLDDFRRKVLKWGPKASSGAIGMRALTALRDKAGSKKKLKEGK